MFWPTFRFTIRPGFGAISVSGSKKRRKVKAQIVSDSLRLSQFDHGATDVILINKVTRTLRNRNDNIIKL